MNNKKLSSFAQTSTRPLKCFLSKIEPCPPKIWLKGSLLLTRVGGFRHRASRASNWEPPDWMPLEFRHQVSFLAGRNKISKHTWPAFQRSFADSFMCNPQVCVAVVVWLHCVCHQGTPDSSTPQVRMIGTALCKITYRTITETLNLTCPPCLSFTHFLEALA